MGPDKIIELHPILSYIINCTQPQEGLRKSLDPLIYHEITHIPDNYVSPPTSDFKCLFEKFYQDRK